MEIFLFLELFQMKYTEYFIEQCNSHHSGAKLSKQQMHRLLEIVKYECLWCSTNSQQNRYSYRKKVNDLTKRRPPVDLWQEMIKLS